MHHEKSSSSVTDSTPTMAEPAATPACRPATLEEELQAIFAIVKAKTGHDFGSYKASTVMRRIERRMAVNDAGGIGKYIALLQKNPHEAHALCQDILIGVTSFFRDPEAFDTLRRDIIPRLFADRDPDDPVRIWHACCATGEEVYSTAMLIREYLDERRSPARVQLFATDIDEVAIAQARAGQYDNDLGAALGEERLLTFFTRGDGHWQVAKSLRDMVVFAHHSLIKDPPFSRLDLMVCRNFLIYLNPDMQKRLISLFHQVLKPGGFLFLGSAESVGHHSELFDTMDKKWKIFTRREGAPRSAAPFPISASIRLPGKQHPTRQAGTLEHSPQSLAEKFLVERYAPPGAVINEKYEVIHTSSRTNSFLEVPVGEPTRDILKMAREELRPALRAAIYKGFAERVEVVFRGVRVGGDGATVNILAKPLQTAQSAERLLMVVFEPAPPLHPLPAQAGETGAAPIPGDETSRDGLIRQLEEQLHITHEQLQATSEQLESSNEGFLSATEELMSINEEFQSANEELQSTNEELETSKEELQALNEELVTVNAELQDKVEELNLATSNMENLLASSGIATIFLDQRLNLKGFTPAAATIFNLIPSDAGRPFRHFAGRIDWPGFTSDTESVLAGRPFAEREVTTLDSGRCYLKRIFPYRTQEGQIDGIVVTLIDITRRKRMHETLLKSEERYRSLVETAQIAIFVNRDNRIEYANPAAIELLGAGGDVIGRSPYDFYHPDFHAAMTERIRGLLAGGSAPLAETSILRADGSERFIESTAVTFADQQGIAIQVMIRDITESKKLKEGIIRQSAILQGINRIFEAVISGRGEEALGKTCLAVAEEVTGSRIGFVAEIGADGLLHGIAINNPGFCSIPGQAEHSEPSGIFHIHGIYGRVLLDGRSFFTNDPTTHPDSIGLPEGHPPLRSFLGVPLMRDGKTAGMVAVGNREGGYSHEELQALESLAPAIMEAFQRMRAEEALQASGDRLRLFIEHAPAALAMFDREMRYLSVSRRWRDNHDLGDRELLGKSHYEILPEITEKWREAHRRGLSGEVVSNEGDQFERADGRVQWMRWELRPWFDVAGLIGGIVIFAEDITKQKQSELAIIRAKQEWERTFDSVPDLIAVMDAQHRIIRVNRAMAGRLGVTPEQCVGRDCYALIHGTDGPSEHCPNSMTLADGQEHVAEMHAERLGGDFLVTTVPLLDNHGVMTGTVHVARDITEQKRAEEALERSKEEAEAANRVKSQFLANMSHELRTPMTGVLGMLDLALSGDLKTEQREFICAARASAHSLIRILNDILDLTKIERGIFSIVEEPFSIRKSVENTFNVLLPVAKRKGLDLDFTVAHDVPETLSGDQTRLNQILTNLAGNAVKFTEKGTVVISVTAGNSAPGGKRALTFTVTDTGIGIPEGKKDRLFREFSQVDDSHSRSYGGTGLGLAISKEIVERMGGEITVISEEGKGSAFSFCIPFAEADTAHCAETAPEKTVAMEAASFSEERNKPRLLLAEDDQTIRHMLKVMLQRTNYEIDIAENGQEAVDMWDSGNYDLILMDVQMPRLNGFEATAAIRGKELGRGGHIPIVAMTAHSLKEDEKRCFSAGMDAYISKPIDFKVCRQLIDDTLRKHGVIPPSGSVATE